MVQDLNATLRLARTVVFSVASLFAFIVLALSASITNYTSSFYYGGYFTFAALGIATAVLTLLTLPPMLLLSLKRQGAVTSMIAVEVGWTWFLWILWLAVGGNSAGFSWLGCSFASGKAESICQQTQAVTAFFS
jgi:magnesium-transporting ATPase (P-type)